MKYVAALLVTTLLWGSSFTAIKLVVGLVNEYRYVWVRAVIALLGLLPLLVYETVRGSRERLLYSLKGGIAAGVAYTLGMWLQGWGTAYTTASNSAFITGLNTVFVHVYQGLIASRYSWLHGMSLGLAVVGLYLLTAPQGGLGIGETLVLLGAIAWAAQVIIVDKYSGSSPPVFTFAEAAVAVSMIIPDAVVYGDPFSIPIEALPLLAYLGIVCTDAAFALQVYGQRGVDPAAAAIIFLLEPVFAHVIARFLLGEEYGFVEVFGAGLIVAAAALAVRAGGKLGV